MSTDSGVFVKITNYAEDIQKGNLYCPPIQYFIDLEKDTVSKGRGDPKEAQIPIFRSITRDNNSIEEISCTRSSGYEHFPVFCVCYLPQDNDGKCKFTALQKKEFVTFGGDCIIISDIDKFIHRVEMACAHQGYQLVHSFVHYEDFWDPSPKVKSIIDKNPLAACFRKDRFFANQSEYRFVICHELSEEKDHLVLNVGDLSDISQVCKDCFSVRR